MPLKLSAVFFLATMLTACATTASSEKTNSAVCTVWRPISWSAKDTERTVIEVKANNARRGGYCK